MRTFSLFLFAFVLFVSPAVFAQEANLIPNPSLEIAAGTSPQDWQKVYWGSVSPTFLYPAGGRTGVGASVSLSRLTSGDARFEHKPVAVQAGAKYNYSNWYKANVPTEVNVKYIHTDGRTTYFRVADAPSSPSTWKQVSATITIPSGVKEAVVYHIIERQGVLTVDDFSLVKQGGTTLPDQPSLSLIASPSSIVPGSSATLSWSSQNVTSCTASGGWSGTKVINGSLVVAPTVSTTYTLTCSGTGGSITQSATVSITTTPPPPSGSFSEGMVTISLDDAWASQYTNALPILDSAGLKATFYINSGPVEGGWLSYMTPSQVLGIAQRGHEIGGHTVSHADLTTLSTTRVDTEIKTSKTYLENLTGTAVTTLAYPYGSSSTTVINRLKLAGYTNARVAGTAISEGFNTAAQNKYEIKSFSPTTAVSVVSIKAAIDRAKQDKQWFVLSYHEVHNNGGEYTTSIANFQTIVNYIKSSGIKVVTMKEGAALLTQ